MKILLLLFFAVSSFAQPTVYTPYTDDITTTGARISWFTAGNAYRNVQLAATPGGPYPLQFVSAYFAQETTHQVWVAGLTPGVTYYYQACNGASPSTGTFSAVASTDVLTATTYVPNNGDLVMIIVGTSGTYSLSGLINAKTYSVFGVSGATFQIDDPQIAGTTAVNITANITSGTRNVTLAACGSEQSFTTLPHTSSEAILPREPDLSANVTTPPTVTGTTYTVGTTAGCTGSGNKASLAACIATVMALNNANNHQMRLPPGKYLGSQLFGQKTGTGWVQVRSDSADSTLPPLGVSMSNGFRDNGSVAEIVSNNWPASSAVSFTTLDDTTTCRGPDDFQIATNSNTIKSPLYRCTSAGLATDTSTITAVTGSDASIVVTTSDAHNCPDNGGIAKMTISGDTVIGNKTLQVSVVSSTQFQVHGATGTPNFAAGTGTVQCNTNLIPYGTYSAAALPADGDACTTEGEVKINTTTGISKIMGCGPGPQYDYDEEFTWDTVASSLVWREYSGINGAYASGGAIEIGGVCLTDGCTNKWYFGPGIIFRTQRMPRFDGWRTGQQGQGKMGQLLSIDVTAQDITFDRTEVHTYPYPNRQGTLISGGGSRISFVESRIYPGLAWIDPLNTFGSGNSESTMIQWIRGDNMLFRNDYFACAGICLFFPESDQTRPGHTFLPVWKIKAYRSYFFKDFERWQTGRHQNVLNGRAYGNRHFSECKRCNEYWFTSNVLDGSFSGTTQGAPFLMTPVDNQPFEGITITSITNGVITYTGTDGDFYRGRVDQPYQTNKGMLIGIRGTSGTDSATHNNKIYEMQDVDPVANTITVVSGLTGTSTGGTATLMSNDVMTGDVTFDWNLVRNSPYGVLMNGHNISSTQITGMTRQGGPYSVSNNLFYNINKRTCRLTNDYGECNFTDPGFNSSCDNNTCNSGIDYNGSSAQFLGFAHGGQHYTVKNNTVIDFRGTGSQNWIVDQSFIQGQNWGMTVKNNLVHSKGTDYTVPDHIVSWNEQREGDTSIGEMGSLGFSKNVYCCNLATAQNSLYTGANAMLFPANVAAIKFSRYRNLVYTDVNYRLKHDSPYKNAGTDGKDIGVDMDEFDKRRGHVRNVGLRRVGTTSAIVGYTVMDTADQCTVEASTSATWGTGNRATDTANTGPRRNTTVTTTSGQTDEIRLMCPTEKYVCNEGTRVCTEVKRTH